MTTTTKRKPAAAKAPDSLATDFGNQIGRERGEWAYLFGTDIPVREPTEAERAAYEERKADPAFAALHALSEKAQAGEDVSLLPVTVLDGGAAPEPEAPARTALEDAADPYERYYRPAANVPFLPSVMPGGEEAAAAHLASNPLPAFTPDHDAPWGGQADGEVTEGGTAVIPAVSAETETFAVTDEDGSS